ncbi:hypothetical protein CLCR_03718 [Cladophialophora carrionii]|uniref:Uncharacterized protein n=1 Tax=Cladophialophora carrionii TaxID=86049 RepID=A0A1C1CHB7_9EURO|nr:hypothetical protein CLCR_03718 [Cladophialophora carrionii]
MRLTADEVMILNRSRFTKPPRKRSIFRAAIRLQNRIFFVGSSSSFTHDVIGPKCDARCCWQVRVSLSPSGNYCCANNSSFDRAWAPASKTACRKCQDFVHSRYLHRCSDPRNCVLATRLSTWLGHLQFTIYNELLVCEPRPSSIVWQQMPSAPETSVAC